MPNFDTTIAKQQLNKFDFKKLFTQEMGWDNIFNKSITICVDKINYELKPIAQKRLLVVYECCSEIVPNRAIQKKIHAETRKISHENFIIFTNKMHTAQQWFFVWRDPGKTIRAHVYEPSEDLYQRLEDISFSIQEEETLSPIEVLSRIRSSFDVDRVTRSFYDNFKKEHTALMKFLEGIPDQDLKSWYVSVTLNRLMFVYFIQKQKFLDNNRNYLVDKLADSKKCGTDLFYRNFLCPLFFEGFAKQERDDSEINKLLGDVPYLNGGIFQKHQLEERFGETIQIPDKAFDRLFQFFDTYRWHLDDRPTREQNEINPDVLGYIFEKYINQKQMGAYYTKEDITGYISRNTIIPWLFDQAYKECKIAFEGERSIWDLLQAEPDRYIYQAVQKGCQLELPPEIASGIDDVSHRTLWNTSTPDEYALPTEIWRETIARRQRYEEVRSKLVNGEIRAINDLITYNLDIELFAQDVIQNAEGPELIRAFWKALTSIKILDPTVGSGAFLFAAMNILEPLYEDCIEQMEYYVSLLKPKDHPEKYKHFKLVLAQINQHANTKYYIYKTITLNNLYGVDIMEEAVETCKLRLFLKLVSQVEDRKDFEPLPDIDFNIRAGNSLVGFTSFDEIRDILSKSELTKDGIQVYKKVALLMLPEENEAILKIEEDALLASKAFKRFQEMQNDLDMDAKEFRDSKTSLKLQLDKLHVELNNALALAYGINIKDSQSVYKWVNKCQPFHWCIDFYDIIQEGGFDTIIGNPPYVEYRKVKQQYPVLGYKTEGCGDLYAFIVERANSVLKNSGKSGMILPISFVSTTGFKALRDLVFANNNYSWISSYSMRPAKLFDGAEKHLCIWISTKKFNNHNISKIFSTKYHRWYEEERQSLFDNLHYVDIPENLIYSDSIPKIGTFIENNILKKLVLSGQIEIGKQTSPITNNIVYYTRKLRYFLQFLEIPPIIYEENGAKRITSELKRIYFNNPTYRNIALGSYCSTLFFWYYATYSDERNVNKREVYAFPLSFDSFSDSNYQIFYKLTQELMNNLQNNSEMQVVKYKKYGVLTLQRFSPRLAKSIVDGIDEVLAKHYGFTENELDFIINYDIKYRMGDELLDNADE